VVMILPSNIVNNNPISLFETIHIDNMKIWSHTAKLKQKIYD